MMGLSSGSLHSRGREARARAEATGPARAPVCWFEAARAPMEVLTHYQSKADPENRSGKSRFSDVRSRS
jgi:hypothetical protein